MTAVARLRLSDLADHELVAAVPSDPGAFTILYQRYADRVYARVTHLLGPVPEREDLLQQIFVGLHRALPTFRGEASLSTFLYRITLNVAFDHMRSRKRRAVVEHSSDDLDRLLGPEPSPEARTSGREELREALALVAQLTPARRIAFALVAIEGLDLEQAAELLDISVDATKQRVLQARRDLLDMLDRARRARRSP